MLDLFPTTKNFILLHYQIFFSNRYTRLFNGDVKLFFKTGLIKWFSEFQNHFIYSLYFS